MHFIRIFLLTYIFLMCYNNRYHWSDDILHQQPVTAEIIKQVTHPDETLFLIKQTVIH